MTSGIGKEAFLLQIGPEYLRNSALFKKLEKATCRFVKKSTESVLKLWVQYFV